MRTPLIKSSEIVDFINIPPSSDGDYLYLELWKQMSARAFRKQHPAFPRFLYRYLPPDQPQEWLETNLLDSLFRFSSHKDFNDPFDMVANYTYAAPRVLQEEKVKEIIRRNLPNITWREMKRMIPHTMHNIKGNQIQSTFSRVGVLCFTTNPRSNLMWCHYAKDHTGLMIQFEMFKDYRTLTKSLPIDYEREELPTYNWYLDNKEDIANIVLSKHRDWAYEGERRILRLECAHKYLKVKHEAVTRLFIGHRAKPEFRERVMSIIAERHRLGLSPIALYESKPHPSKYKIVFNRVPISV